MSSNTVTSLTEKTTIAPNDPFLIDDSESSDATKKVLFETLANAICPVGAILDFDKTFPSTPSMLGNFKECDGSNISDADSPYNGYRIRNLNGANVVLTLTWAAGVATVAATDVTALAVGDKVSGTGITPVSGDLYTFITNIAGTTVTISDTTASGSISSTFTNVGESNYPLNTSMVKIMRIK